MVVECALLEDGDVRGPASERIGPPIRPQSVSNIPLFEAIYWIARKGGAEDFNVEDQMTWGSAAEELLEKVRSKQIKLTGRRSERAKHDPNGIPAEEFYGVLTVVPPFQSEQDFADKVFDDVSRLELSSAGGQQRSGDKLFSADLRPAWLDIRVSGAAVAQFWPFRDVSMAQLPSQGAIDRSWTSSAAEPQLKPTEKKIWAAINGLWASKVPDTITLTEFQQQVGKFIMNGPKGVKVPAGSSFKRFWKAQLGRGAH